jgi:hypothetical protein
VSRLAKRPASAGLALDTADSAEIIEQREDGSAGPFARAAPAGGSGLQTASPHPSEWPLTWSNSQNDHVNNVPCPLYVRAGSDAKWLTPRTVTDSVRASRLTCNFTILASFSRRRRSAPPPGRPDAGPLAQAAARRCPATIRLTGGSSRQRLGWCSDPQLCDHEFLGVLFSLLARLSTVAVFCAGGSLRIHARTRVPEATCPACGALSRRVHLRSG